MKALDERTYPESQDLHAVISVSLEHFWSDSHHHDSPHTHRLVRNKVLKTAAAPEKR